MSRKTLLARCVLNGRHDLISCNGAQTHHSVTEVRANLFGLTSGPPVEFAAKTFAYVAIAACAAILA